MLLARDIVKKVKVLVDNPVIPLWTQPDWMQKQEATVAALEEAIKAGPQGTGFKGFTSKHHTNHKES